jgi:hypothetical protein
MKIAIAKRRSKRLAAGVVFFAESLNIWYLTLYGVTNGAPHPFGASPFDNEADALNEGNETLKVNNGDWIDLPENEIDDYIKTNTRNRWDVM